MQLALYREESRHLSRLAWPIIISQVGAMLMGLVDTIVVGRYSSLELAGVAAANSIFWTLVMIGFGLLGGMDPIVSQAYGARDEQRALRCFGVCLRISVLFCLLATGPLLWLAFNIGITGATPDIAEAGKPYMALLSLGLLPLMLSSAIQRYWQCQELVLPFTLIILVANVFNLVLDIGFVTGRWGMPELGAAGVAIATTGCRLFMLAAAVWITLREWRSTGRAAANWQLVKDAFWRGDKPLQKEFLRLGLPAAGQMTLEVSAFSLTTLLMASLGAMMLATHHIILTIASFSFMVPLGISAATATRVGYHVGRKDLNRAFPTGWLGMGAGIAVMAISALILYFFPAWLLGWFTEDPKVIELGITVIFLCALFQIFDGLQVVSAGALRGLGDTKTAFYANLVSHWGIGLPVGYTLCFLMDKGIWGMWVGLALGLLLTSLVNTTFWRRKERLALGTV